MRTPTDIRAPATARFSVISAGLLVLGGCHGGDSTAYEIAVTVVGLRPGSTLLLQDSAAAELEVDSNGRFTFASPVASGREYAVTIASQPAGQSCLVRNGSGTVGDAPPEVAVDCPHFVYVANGLSNSVAAFGIDLATGALSPIAGSPYPIGAPGPNALSFTPDGRFAYEANALGNSISAFAIDGVTGALTAVPGSPFAACGGPFAVTIAPTGAFLYAVNMTFSGTICAFGIDPTSGGLSPVGGSPFATGAYPSPVAIDPAGRGAYATSNGGCNCVSAFRLDASTGALSPAGTTDIGAGTVAVTIDPTGKLAFVVDYANGRLLAFAIDPLTGALAPAPGSPFVTGAASGSVVVGPTGRYVYVANADGTVSGFAIDAATGRLDTLAGSPFGAGASPAAIAMDPTGRWVFVPDVLGATAVYEVDAPSGRLSPASGSPLSISCRPSFDPTGRFVYLAQPASQMIDPHTGLPTNPPGAIFGYSLEDTAGALELVPGSPFAVDTGSLFMSIL